MKNIAFEISDAHEHHAHIAPLIDAFLNSSSFNVNLYSSDEKHIDVFYDLYSKIYFKANKAKIHIIKPEISHKLKHVLVSFFKSFNSGWLVKVCRHFYGYIRGVSSIVESGNRHYLNNIDFFTKQEVVFTTELKGGIVLKDTGTKLVFCLHGIISNGNPFFKDWSCDLVVSPSLSLASRLRKESNFPITSQIYKHAYLKKDVINRFALNIQNENLFNKQQFTFLYNPHWDNSLGQSSWSKFGEKILNFFFDSPQYNLIFAPHILLDKYFGLKLENKYFQAPNILIDINSDKLYNGFYIPHTDCYMGDVSSQYFEFLLCNKNIQGIFINVTLMDWEYLNHYEYWKNGDVAESFDELKNLIEEYAKQNKAYSKTELYDQIFSDIPDNQVDKLKEFIVKNYLQ